MLLAGECSPESPDTAVNWISSNDASSSGMCSLGDSLRYMKYSSVFTHRTLHMED